MKSPESKKPKLESSNSESTKKAKFNFSSPMREKEERRSSFTNYQPWTPKHVLKCYSAGMISRDTPNFKCHSVSAKKLVPRIPSPDKRKTLISGEGLFIEERNNYRIVEMLGSGSYFIVYKVRCLKTNKLYALKKSRKTFFSDDHLKPFLRETHILKTIGAHSNIVPIHAAWFENNEMFYLSPVFNFTLKDWPCGFFYKFEDLKVSEIERGVWKLLLDLSNALSLIHEKGFVHMDVKPGNILVRRTENQASRQARAIRQASLKDIHQISSLPAKKKSTKSILSFFTLKSPPKSAKRHLARRSEKDDTKKINVVKNTHKDFKVAEKPNAEFNDEPENVNLRVSPNFLKDDFLLTDFGQAREAGKAHKDDPTDLGEWRYRPPEILRVTASLRHDDEAVTSVGADYDVYSLGMTAFDVIMGTILPYNALEKIYLGRIFEFFEETEWSTELKNLVAEMLSSESASRPTARIVHEECKKYFERNNLKI